MNSHFTPLSIERQPTRPANSWRWVKLTDLAKLESGHTPSRYRPDWWGGDVPWLALPDIRKLDGQIAFETTENTNQAGLEHSSARLLPEGTVCLSRTASVGYVTVLGRPMATSQDFVNWICGSELDPIFLMHLMVASRDYLRSLSSGAIHKTIYVPTVKEFSVCIPNLSEQKRIAAMLNEQMAIANRTVNESRSQVGALDDLISALLRDSLTAGRQTVQLSTCLIETSKGVGSSWNSYSVLGATRAGLALAKEPVGKQPERYKLVDEGTIFYNPMRILLGSIATVDSGDTPGITSPDYVVFKCNPNRLHHRWFYRWLRSRFGEQFIKGLTRGAVRERLLFKRLAAATIEVPPIEAQRRVSDQLPLIRNALRTLDEQIALAMELSTAYLRRVFSGEL